jgi:hypothetical protein
MHAERRKSEAIGGGLAALALLLLTTYGAGYFLRGKRLDILRDDEHGLVTTYRQYRTDWEVSFFSLGASVESVFSRRHVESHTFIEPADFREKLLFHEIQD